MLSSSDKRPDVGDTRDITSYLRGFAIVVVLANHFINAYVSGQFIGYANGVISIFFVLSGYGIFHSVKRDFEVKGESLTSVLRFYYSRALRIFPLYWLFLLIITYTSGTLPSIWIWLGIPIELAPGVGYFVTLLIQCYLFAPLLYIGIKKLGLTKYLGLVFGALFITYIASLTFPPPTAVYAYHGAVLGHLFLFALGMAIPNLLLFRSPPNINRILSAILLLFSFLLFWVTVHYTRPTPFPPEIVKYINPFFILSAFVFCFLMILTKPRLVLARILILLGTYSYSIYLFHVFFYQGLGAIGALKPGNELKSIGFLILAFPLYLLACILTEKLASRFRKILQHNSTWLHC
jgi:peptidoglycan/LPS O-acetylase OafA/YrhL